MAGSPGIEPASVAGPDIPGLVRRALLDEVWLTPKPGLVDAANNGAHHDMDLPMFLGSIAAIGPWFSTFHDLGLEHAERRASEMLRLIRPAGIACEQAMFQATQGVNTHKGGVFSLGLLATAAGRLWGQGKALTVVALCSTVSEICNGIVERELKTAREVSSVGEKLYQRFGLTGARGEAESGFLTVRQYVLPYWWTEGSPKRRLLAAMLRLMAANQDTNLVSRGGISGLRYVQRYSARLLQRGWHEDEIRQMDADLIARNLSPGGSADLLAVSVVLAEIAM